MFFLLRVAFWLTIVLALLPSGGTQQSAQASAQNAIGPTELDIQSVEITPGAASALPR